MDNQIKIDESSPSVQTHLGILQTVIQRMAANSNSSKTWCITIVSAVLVIVADKGKPEYAWIAILPTFLFLCLDGYYLALEKSYRGSYNVFIKKLHEGNVTSEDLYSVIPEGNQSKYQIEALKSFSIWGFYLSLFILVGLAKYVVLS